MVAKMKSSQGTDLAKELENLLSQYKNTDISNFLRTFKEQYPRNLRQQAWVCVQKNVFYDNTHQLRKFIKENHKIISKILLSK
ncbi:MAG: hypothetical protein AAF316_00035 [Cyanobacteria bacterium P01_A01_bin.80]